MKAIFEKLIAIGFTFFATVLFFSTGLLLFRSLWRVYVAVAGKSSFSVAILNVISVTVISIAIIEVSRYIIEEEIYVSRSQEEQSQEQITNGIIKIYLIIIISVGLEGLVLLFKSGLENASQFPYPAIIVVASAISLVALGIYQRLSKK
jgi:hypothetical protein